MSYAEFLKKVGITKSWHHQELVSQKVRIRTSSHHLAWHQGHATKIGIGISVFRITPDGCQINTNEISIVGSEIVSDIA